MLFGFCSFLFVPARLVLMVHCIAHIIVCPERLVVYIVTLIPTLQADVFILSVYPKVK